MSTLWGSYWDGHARAPLRIGLASIAALELLVECSQIDWQSQDPTRFPPRGALAEAIATVPGAAWILYALILVGLVAVARDRYPIAAGAWALGWAAVLIAWQTQIFGSPSRNAFFPGAVLLGWILGQAWAHAAARQTGHSPDQPFRERLGEAGALGCLAAAYVGSCASKLLTAGAGWADGAQVRALVLQQQPVADWASLATYRDAIVEQPTLAAAAAIVTLVIEGGALLLMFGPRLRLLWASALVGLHVNVILLCTMPYLEPMLLLALFVVPWPWLMRRREHAIKSEVRDPHRLVMPARMIAVLAALVAAAWVLAPWGWRGEQVDPNPAWVDEPPRAER